jgi:hypothetical protein
MKDAYFSLDETATEQQKADNLHAAKIARLDDEVLALKRELEEHDRKIEEHDREIEMLEEKKRELDQMDELYARQEAGEDVDLPE